MSAETLRRAAALMRERAEAATPGPWRPYTTGGWGHGNYVTTDDLSGVAMQYALVWRPTDAEHIASWHPAVALAVADLLDNTAGHVEYTGATEASEDVRDALAVARAYLGEVDA